MQRHVQITITTHVKTLPINFCGKLTNLKTALPSLSTLGPNLNVRKKVTLKHKHSYGKNLLKFLLLLVFAKYRCITDIFSFTLLISEYHFL